MGFNGATEISTPDIDRLARQGVIFSNGYASAPFCSPSRAGLMTGRYPARFGVLSSFAHAPFDHAHGLPVEETTFATRLQDAGYRTSLIGKWHLGSAPPFHPLNRGFDSFYGILAGEHDYYRIDVTDSSPSSAGRVDLLPLGKDRGAAAFNGYLTDALTDSAVAFIREERQAPFFLYLAYNAPHTPLQAPSALIRKYVHAADRNRRRYLAMVDALDSNVGRVLDTLEETGTRDNTLVFFLSDNGGVHPFPDPATSWADNGPFRAGKGTLFEGGIRVPFVGSWPARWPQGSIFKPMVINLDIAATVLAAANVHTVPERPLDGVDLDPFVREATSGAPHEFLFWRIWNANPVVTAYAVRAGNLKLVGNFRDSRDGAAALFDLHRDPGETSDVIGEQPYGAVRMAARWNDWNRQNVGRRFIDYSSYAAYLSEKLKVLAERHEGESAASIPFEIGMEPPHPRWAPSCSNGLVVREPERNPGLVADCEALRGMLDTLSGMPLIGWRVDRPIRSWDGVVVGGADGVDGSPDRVRELRLNSRRVAGSLPQALEAGKLDGLEVLDLGRNLLTGAVPSWLGNLTRLRVIVFSHNDLSGPLPPELGSLSSLEELWLGGNRLTGPVPPEWGGLSSLRLFRLAGVSRIACIPPALKEVENNDLGSRVTACPTPPPPPI